MRKLSLLLQREKERCYQQRNHLILFADLRKLMMKRIKNQQICAKHKRKMTFICRNMDQCGCCFKLFCERCVSTIQKNNKKTINQDILDIPHDFEQYEEFQNKLEELLVTNENFSQILTEIWKQFQENQLHSKTLKRRISLDLFVSEQLNTAFKNNLLLDTHQQSNGVSQINQQSLNLQNSNQIRVFYSDKIVQKYLNLLQEILNEEHSQKFYNTILCNQFSSIKGKYIKQHKFDGIQRQFPKYFVMQNRFLYAYNQEQFYFSQYDLSLGVELPNQIIFPDGIKIPNKCQITPLTDNLIAIHHQKILYVIDINKPEKYHKYIFKDIIQNLTAFGNNCKRIIIQFRGRLELWSFQSLRLKCIKKYYHPVIQFYNNKCLMMNETKHIIWFCAFSLLDINLITGDIDHHIISREYMDFNPNCFFQNIEELINDILAQSIGCLRKFSIQNMKKINSQLILVQYQDFLEIRGTSDFSLVQRIENLQCEAISIVYGSILVLAKSKEKTNIQLVNLEDYSLQQLFSSKEMYTKAIYCDQKLYLLKHTYFEISNRNSYFNSLVIDIYS